MLTCSTRAIGEFLQSMEPGCCSNSNNADLTCTLHLFSLQEQTTELMRQIVVRANSIIQKFGWPYLLYHYAFGWPQLILILKVLLFGGALGQLVSFSIGPYAGDQQETVSEESVTISPLGVQLSSSTSTQAICGLNKEPIESMLFPKRTKKSVPLFLPRSDIIDVIISEVILSYKVVSVVHFRVIKNKNHHKLLRSLIRKSISTLRFHFFQRFIKHPL